MSVLKSHRNIGPQDHCKQYNFTNGFSLIYFCKGQAGCQIKLNSSRKLNFNPILHGGGQIDPPCRILSLNASNGLIFGDFVPCNIRKVLGRPFLKFFQKFQNFSRKWIFSKFSKNQKFQKKIFFLWKSYFLYLNMNCACSQLSFEVHNMSVAEFFSILTFLL